MQKASKSIHSVAESVDVRHTWNVLAMFLNNTAVLPLLGLTAVFWKKLTSQFFVIQSVLLRQSSKGVTVSLKKRAVLSHIVVTEVFLEKGSQFILNDAENVGHRRNALSLCLLKRGVLSQLRLTAEFFGKILALHSLSVAGRHRRNGLAIYRKKRAVLSHLAVTAVFFEKVRVAILRNSQ